MATKWMRLRLAVPRVIATLRVKGLSVDRHNGEVLVVSKNPVS